MDIESVPDVLNGSGEDLNGLSSAAEVDKLMMKSPVNPGESTDRIKRRVRRQNSREGIENTVAANGSLSNGTPVGTYFAPQRRWKNSRRSHNGRNDKRGLPKKNGAGGKGVWGILGSELLVEEDVVDAQDPNYDIENDRNTELLEVIPEPTADEFYKMMEPIMLELFENGDTNEAMRSLADIITGAHNVLYLVISCGVEISMNHKDSHREMTSLMISDMYGRLMKPQDIIKGFNLLLDNLPDLVLDTPEAATMLGNFIARAVADDCIPPVYVFGNVDRDSFNKHAQKAIKRAESLLLLKTTMVHLDNVWGSAGPLRPVKNITKRMAALLKEFVDSRDVTEAQHCLRGLEVPHYHHELVYEAIVLALEAVNNTVAEAMCQLLASLDESCLVTPATMEQGFQRVYDDMTDIVLDVPLAYIMLDRFVDRCHARGFLTEKIVAKMPSRGRKRFVSEGDGGHLKPSSISALF